MGQKKDSGSTAKMILIAGFFVVIILLYFNHISNKASEVKEQKYLQKVNKVVA